MALLAISSHLKKNKKTYNQFFLIIFVQFKSGIVQFILCQIRRRVFKPFWTGLLQVGQRTFSSFEMIVNLESLIPFIKSSEFSQKGKVLFRILRRVISIVFLFFYKSCHWRGGGKTYLLRILCDHEDQLEIVHSQSYIVELVHIGKEDDILDCILYDLRVDR